MKTFFAINFSENDDKTHMILVLCIAVTFNDELIISEWNFEFLN